MLFYLNALQVKANILTVALNVLVVMRLKRKAVFVSFFTIFIVDYITYIIESIYIHTCT